MRWVGALGFVLILAACGGGSSGTSTGASGAAHHAIGESVSIQGTRVTVASVARTALNTVISHNPAGYIGIGFDITIENQRVTAFHTDPGEFVLKDASGQKYQTDDFADLGTLTILDGDVPSGERLRGSVIFAVPPDAVGLTLSFQPATDFELLLGTASANDRAVFDVVIPAT